MSRLQPGAALVAALGLTLALLPGCGNSTSAYIPNAATAREGLDTALAAWQKGGKPAQLATSEHPVHFVDSQWEAGQVLDSFEILEEKPGEVETEKRYGVVLKMKPPAREKKPATELRVDYVAVGRSPLWIFRDEDYKKQVSMGEEPKAKTKFKRSTRGR